MSCHVMIPAHPKATETAATNGYTSTGGRREVLKREGGGREGEEAGQKFGHCT